MVITRLFVVFAGIETISLPFTVIINYIILVYLCIALIFFCINLNVNRYPIKSIRNTNTQPGMSTEFQLTQHSNGQKADYYSFKSYILKQPGFKMPEHENLYLQPQV